MSDPAACNSEPSPVSEERLNSSKRSNCIEVNTVHQGMDSSQSKKPKLAEQGDERMPFTMAHSLAPSTVVHFRSAAHSLAAHLNTLGLSPSESYLASLGTLCRTSPTKISIDDLVQSRLSLRGIQPHVLGAAFIIRNELAHLIEQEYDLEEAVRILTNRVSSASTHVDIAPTFPSFEFVQLNPPQPQNLSKLDHTATQPAQTKSGSWIPLSTDFHPRHAFEKDGTLHGERNGASEFVQSDEISDEQDDESESSPSDKDASSGSQADSDMDVRINSEEESVSSNESNTNSHGNGAEEASAFSRVKRRHHDTAPSLDDAEDEQKDELAVPLKKPCTVQSPY